MSDTPETDEAQFGTGRVSVDFARRLERERDEARKALRGCVFWAESVSRRVTEDRESINWTGLQKAREVLERLTDHKADACETQGLRDELADVKRGRVFF